MTVRLSALYACHPLPPPLKEFLILIFVRDFKNTGTKKYEITRKRRILANIELYN
jgi:hypothetical protein